MLRRGSSERRRAAGRATAGGSATPAAARGPAGAGAGGTQTAGSSSEGSDEDPASSTDAAGAAATLYRPLVAAHRGASDELAEHTLAAYQRAIDEGADALECDVRLTRDGHLVCVHDRRVERTSNGRGVVSEFDLAELSRLDFGSWHPGLPDSADELIRPGAPEPDRLAPERQPVLTFAELLSLAVDAPRPVKLLVETKHPTRYGGLVERALVTELRRYGLHNPPDPAAATVTVMSFSLLAVRRVGELAPKLPTVLLLNGLPVWLRTGGLPGAVRIAGPSIDVVRDNPQFVHRMHEAGNQVYVWTVNEPSDVDLVTSLRVDGIITDRPAMRSLRRP